MNPSKKIVFAFAIISLVSLISVYDAKSQSTGTIFINPDGSISGTDKIQHEGNLYTLTADLYYSPITVLCNNVVFDGHGFTLQGPQGWVSGISAINLTCTNATVCNFSIVGFWEVGVLGNYNGNTICNNSITKTDRAISIYASNYNVSGNYLVNNDRAIRVVGNNINIYRNNIASNADGIWMTNGTDCTIIANNMQNNGVAVNTDYGGFVAYHNNFIDQTVGHDGSWSATVLLTAYYSQGSNVTIRPWDNGYPSGGNYWSDYAARYPNASQTENSGIGDTAYLIGIECAINSTTVNSYVVEAIDRYPLMQPINISETTIIFPSSTSTANLTLSPPVSPSQLPSNSATPTVSSISTPLPTRSEEVTPTPLISQNPTSSANQLESRGISLRQIAYGATAIVAIAAFVAVAVLLRKHNNPEPKAPE